MKEFKKYTILVVDDDIDLREVIAAIIEEIGFTTLVADCGNRAIEIIRSTQVDLVLTDMRMPNGDGLFLLDKIRALDPKKPIVFFITGYSDISEQEFITRGAAKVFPKPFDRNLLVAEIKRVLNL